MGLTIIYAVLIFCLLIFVHELGHFAAAKAVDIRVDEFSLGMGPSILKFVKGETRYSLRIFPIGGYVKMEGADEDSDDPRAFNRKTGWQKTLVVVAGSAMNLLTTVIIITVIAMIAGVATNIIGEVSPDYPAHEAGLLSGDKIVKIGDENVKGWGDVTAALAENTGDTVTITVKRGGENITLTSDMIIDGDGRKIIGITSKSTHSIVKSVKTGFAGTWLWMREMVNYLGRLFGGRGSMQDLVGPVGIVSIINDQAKLGPIYIANLTALISLNLAIVNMLPLPALDGGRLMFLVIRRLTGKIITDEIEAKIHLVGIMLLLGLMVYLVVQDVDRFIF